MKYKIKDRIIPCPKYISAKEGYAFFRNRTKIVLKIEETTVIKSGYDLLNSLCSEGYLNPDFVITLKRLDEYYTDKKLERCENLDQAYIIKPVIVDKVYSGIDLMAYTDVGLYYACSTLYQAIEQISEKEIDIPYIDVTDWPSCTYRGLFLGDYIRCLDKTSFLKLNALDFVYNTKSREKEDKIYADCEKYGVTVFSAVFEWDNPKEIFERLWIKEKRNNLLFWIKDECEESDLHYEANRIIEAFIDYKKDCPELKAGIITNSKGNKTFDRIFALSQPEDFSISYCDKLKTYNTDVRELTDSTVSAYTKKGGLFGIYPMIAYDSKSFFLWTAPEFIQFRCSEFDRINAHKVMGYTPFACSFSKFNIAAFSEWLWNPKGRNTIDFIKAYSYKNNLDFDKFENMLYYLTFASWSLQRSNFVQVICDDPIDFKKIKKLPKLSQMTNDSLKAIKFAEMLQDQSYIDEAKATYSALVAYSMTRKLAKLDSAKKPDQKKYLQYLQKLDDSCKTVYTCLMEWAEFVKEEAGAYDAFIYETAKAFLHLPKLFDRFGSVKEESDSEN